MICSGSSQTGTSVSDSSTWTNADLRTEHRREGEPIRLFLLPCLGQPAPPSHSAEPLPPTNLVGRRLRVNPDISPSESPWASAKTQYQSSKGPLDAPEPRDHHHTCIQKLPLKWGADASSFTLFYFSCTGDILQGENCWLFPLTRAEPDKAKVCELLDHRGATNQTHQKPSNKTTLQSL